MGRWRRRLALAFLEFADTGVVLTALDVGCGTGALVDAVAQRPPGMPANDPSRSAGSAVMRWLFNGSLTPHRGLATGG